MFKKLVLLVWFSLVYFTSAFSQVSIGAKVSKINHGIVFTAMSKQNRTGFQLMAGYSKIAAGGWIVKPTIVKQFPIHNYTDADWYYFTGIGAHAALYNYYYYKIINDRQGVYIYPNKRTFTLGADIHFGIKYQSSDVPINLLLTMNPFIDFVNKGPEWIDYFCFGIEYRFDTNKDWKR